MDSFYSIVIVCYCHGSFWYLYCNWYIKRETPSGWFLHPSDMSSFILNIPYYQAHLVSFLLQAFFHGTLVPFNGRWYLEAKILVLGVFIATGILLLPDLSVQLGGACVYVRLSLCMCVYGCVCVCLFLCEFVLFVFVPTQHYGILLPFLVSYLYLSFSVVRTLASNISRFTCLLIPALCIE